MFQNKNNIRENYFQSFKVSKSDTNIKREHFTEKKRKKRKKDETN